MALDTPGNRGKFYSSYRNKVSILSVYFLLSSHPPIIFPPSPSVSGPLSSPEADDLAQYLDHLLAQAAPHKPKRQIGGGLGRFKAVATKTKDMVSLKNKAQELDVHSEYIHRLGSFRTG